MAALCGTTLFNRLITVATNYILSLDPDIDAEPRNIYVLATCCRGCSKELSEMAPEYRDAIEFIRETIIEYSNGKLPIYTAIARVESLRET